MKPMYITGKKIWNDVEEKENLKKGYSNVKDDDSLISKRSDCGAR
jgi:hypothetical protein